MNENAGKLYRTLGYKGPIPEEVTDDLLEASEVEPDMGERPLLAKEHVAEIKRRYAENPDEIQQWFIDNWGDDVTEDDIWDALEDAENALNAPEEALESFESLFSLRRQTQLPPNFTFPGMTREIEIDPGSKKFETKGDAINWVLFAGPQFIGDKIHLVKKDDFRLHDQFDSNFVYDLTEPPNNGGLDIALFSDFGTGEYHSLYIARQLQQRKFPYAIHLGDVYYAGRRSEFRDYFEGPLDPILSDTKLFTMNANHELLSGGFPYFDYMKRRRQNHANQEQEGSYFCLRSQQFQIVGIDTAYHEVGRFQEKKLLAWLEKVLSEGRDQGRTNILLSPDDPYSYGKIGLRDLLDEDLSSIVLEKKLVDLWFWGNTHYCALFDRTDDLPFLGSCIGHGGYAYTRKRRFQTSPAPVKFLETMARFPAWTKVRQDRGNNGFCILKLKGNGSIELEYVDWMSNTRCIAQLAVTDGEKLTVKSVEEMAEPEELM
ncbi:MAG: hypothetical protein CL608_17240 [Anaerolineaceae bacterium]|nr:hypothetical protein [Anaerolineaceae bacterium]